MARINKKNILSGKIGNLVFRNLHGKQIVQAKPEKVNQSKATKLSGADLPNVAVGLNCCVFP